MCTFYPNIHLPFDLGPFCAFAQSYHQVSTLHPLQPAPLSENDLLFPVQNTHPLPDHVHELDARVSTVEDGLQHLWDHSEMWRARNFASKGEGAKIIQDFTSETHGIPRETINTWLLRKLRGFDVNRIHINPPTVVLEKTLDLGECWEFTGASGQIGISFARPIKLANVTIYQARGIVSAKENGRTPRDIVLWGQTNTPGNFSSGILENRTMEKFFGPGIRSPQLGTHLRLAEMEYAQVSKAQTFKLSQAAENVDASFEGVVVQVLSNWGAPTTCLYHIGVQGVDTAEEF